MELIQQVSMRLKLFFTEAQYGIIIISCMMIMIPDLGKTEENIHLYSTGTVMEIDRCASAWLIKRYVDKEAVFKFFPDGELINVGIPFDTPDAKLQRTHKQSAFEVILAEYKINDPRLQEITKAIHDLEINLWGNTTRPESRKMEANIKTLINNVSNNDERLRACFYYFDGLVAQSFKE